MWTQSIFPREMYTIEDVERMPIDDVRDYVRRHVPYDDHFFTTEMHLRYIALQMMNKDGELDPVDASLLNIPMFGKIYAMSSGDIFQSLLVAGVDVTPGMSHIAAVKQFLDTDS